MSRSHVNGVDAFGQLLTDRVRTPVHRSTYTMFCLVIAAMMVVLINNQIMLQDILYEQRHQPVQQASVIISYSWNEHI